MKAPYLFDSHTFINQKAIFGDTERLICAINVGEIVYLTKRRFVDLKNFRFL
jgi:hypothetical protein